MTQPDGLEHHTENKENGFNAAGQIQSAWKTANEETLDAYEHGVPEYNAAAVPEVEGSVKEWVDKSLALLPEGAHILEIGSAHGRDADYIESHGFTVDRTDATKAFVEYLGRQGHSARVLNALTEEEYGGPYDMVYANAVLHHFSPDETKAVLDRARHSLTDDGVLSFSVKIGKGAGWSVSKIDGRRFFSYWEEEPLRELLTTSGYDVVDCSEGKTGHNSGDWFHVIARKLSVEPRDSAEK